jgi:hypothetical protein
MLSDRERTSAAWERLDRHRAANRADAPLKYASNELYERSSRR